MEVTKTPSAQVEVGISCNCLLFGGASSASMLIVVPFKVAFSFSLRFEREGAFRLTVNWVAAACRCAGVAGRMAGLIIFVEVVVLKKFGLVFCFILVAALFAAGAVFADTVDPHDPHAPVKPDPVNPNLVTVEAQNTAAAVTTQLATVSTTAQAKVNEALTSMAAVGADGKYYPNAAAKQAAFEAAVDFLPDGATSADLLALPVFVAALPDGSPAGSTADIMFPVANLGTKYAGKKPSEIRIIKIISSDDVVVFQPVTNLALLDDGYFAIVTGTAAADVVTGALVAGTEYSVRLAIKDGGRFDLDGEANSVIFDPAMMSPSTEAAGGGSSSGCSLGFAPAALLLVAPLFFLKRK